MKKFIYVIGLSFFVSFCSSDMTTKEGGKKSKRKRSVSRGVIYHERFKFSDRETQFIHRKGNGAIFGKAFLKREEDKGMMTCAKNEVLLIPMTKYSSERIRFFYGNTNQGFSKKMQRIKDGPEKYYQNRRETRCDQRGRFRFVNVPAGKYYILTSIYWKVESLAGEFERGGEIMKRIELKKGEQKDLMIYEMIKSNQRLGNKMMI